MAPLSLLMMLFAVSLAWAAWSFPGLIHITGSVAEACQTLFVRCVELLSIGKLFFFWSGALLVLSGVVYAAIKAASDIIKTNRAVSFLPVSRKGSRNLLIIENDGLKAAFTHGLLKPRIYISTGLMKCLSRDELRAVFLHELCHRDKLDPLRFLALGFADLLLEPGLDVQMDVLQLPAEDELAALDLGLYLLQPPHYRLRVVAGDDTLPGQHADVGYRDGDVMAVQPPVKGDGGRMVQGPAVPAAR